nr:helicase C-terminal domain-containing protein [Bacillus sp. AFS041924]
MQIELNQVDQTKTVEKNEKIIEKLKDNNGSTLILFNSTQEMKKFKQQIEQEQLDFNLYFEGEEEISSIVQKFQEDTNASLCAVHLWEGLDIQGESLSQVIIHSLPFPPNDPVFQSKRQNAQNPYNEIDEPYMLLRLRQGIGRLIRSHEDKGKIILFIENVLNNETKEKILNCLPVNPS